MYLESVPSGLSSDTLYKSDSYPTFSWYFGWPFNFIQTVLNIMTLWDAGCTSVSGNPIHQSMKRKFFQFSYIFTAVFVKPAISTSKILPWVDGCFCVSDDTLKLLKELTSKKPLQVPSIYYHLPHLLQNEGSLQPAVQIGNGRTGGRFILFLVVVAFLVSIGSWEYYIDH